jgi:hypothetical protein
MPLSPAAGDYECASASAGRGYDFSASMMNHIPDENFGNDMDRVKLWPDYTCSRPLLHRLFLRRDKLKPGLSTENCIPAVAD